MPKPDWRFQRLYTCPVCSKQVRLTPHGLECGHRIPVIYDDRDDSDG